MISATPLPFHLVEGRSTTIVVISDTHNRHRGLLLPPGDILIHCGDFTGTGTDAEVADFASWFAKQPHKVKLVVAGNHELGFQALGKAAKDRFPGATYLLDEAIEVGGIKFYGTPWCPWFGDWEFGLQDGPRGLGAKFDQIPEDTQVLITHTPPNGVLDHVPDFLGSMADPQDYDRFYAHGHDIGSVQLRNAVQDRLKSLKIHVFGHCHASGGFEVRGGVLFANAAILDENYEFSKNPVVICC